MLAVSIGVQVSGLLVATVLADVVAEAYVLASEQASLRPAHHSPYDLDAQGHGNRCLAKLKIAVFLGLDKRGVRALLVVSSAD